MLILVPERRVADEENVQDDAARPYVDWFPVRLLLQHLRAEVAGCPSKTFLSISQFHLRPKDKDTRIERPGQGFGGSRRYVSEITFRVLLMQT